MPLINAWSLRKTCNATVLEKKSERTIRWERLPSGPCSSSLCGFEVWLPLPPGTVASLVAECPAPCIPRSCVSPTRTILFVAVCGLDSDFPQLSCDSSEKRSWFLLLTSLGFGAVEFDAYLSIPVALVYFL